jgi:hypothetical protein
LSLAHGLSPEFKLYLIKEFQRLKDEENDRLKLEWNLQRTLAKINYRIHTDAIKETLIPPSITKSQASAVYSSEADLLNVALFGQTPSIGVMPTPMPREISETTPRWSSWSSSPTSKASTPSSSVLIRQGLPQSERLTALNGIAITQMKTLLAANNVKRLK